MANEDFDPFEGFMAWNQRKEQPVPQEQNTDFAMGSPPAPTLDPQADLEQWHQRALERDKQTTIAANLQDRSELTRGFLRGVDQMQGSLYGAAGLVGSAVGSEGLKKWGIEGYQRNEEEAQLNPATVPTLEDIHGVSDFGKWAGGKIGELAPSVLEAMGTAAAGAIAGTAVGPEGTVAGGVYGAIAGRTAVKSAIKNMVEGMVERGIAREAAEKTATNLAVKGFMRDVGTKAGIVAGTWPLEAGGNYMEGLERGIDSPGTAAATGLASSFLELAGGNSRVIRKVMGDKTYQAFQSALDKADTRLISKIVKEAATEAPQEFGQEAAQELLSMANIAMIDPTFEKVTSENIHRLIEAGAAGALGGAVFGGAGAVKEHLSKQGAEARSDELKRRIENLQKVAGNSNAAAQNLEKFQEELTNLQKQYSDLGQKALPTEPSDLEDEIQFLEQVKRTGGEELDTASVDRRLTYLHGALEAEDTYREQRARHGIDLAPTVDPSEIEKERSGDQTWLQMDDSAAEYNQIDDKIARLNRYANRISKAIFNLDARKNPERARDLQARGNARIQEVESRIEDLRAQQQAMMEEKATGQPALEPYPSPMQMMHRPDVAGLLPPPESAGPTKPEIQSKITNLQKIVNGVRRQIAKTEDPAAKERLQARLKEKTDKIYELKGQRKEALPGKPIALEEGVALPEQVAEPAPMTDDQAVRQEYLRQREAAQLARLEAEMPEEGTGIPAKGAKSLVAEETAPGQGPGGVPKPEAKRPKPPPTNGQAWDNLTKDHRFRILGDVRANASASAQWSKLQWEQLPNETRARLNQRFDEFRTQSAPQTKPQEGPDIDLDTMTPDDLLASDLGQIEERAIHRPSIPPRQAAIEQAAGQVQKQQEQGTKQNLNPFTGEPIPKLERLEPGHGLPANKTGLDNEPASFRNLPTEHLEKGLADAKKEQTRYLKQIEGLGESQGGRNKVKKDIIIDKARDLPYQIAAIEDILAARKAAKEAPSDRQSEGGVHGEVGIREEPGRPVQEPRPGGEETRASGILQTPEQAAGEVTQAKAEKPSAEGKQPSGRPEVGSTVSWTDRQGNTHTGEITQWFKGQASVKDESGKIFAVSTKKLMPVTGENRPQKGEFPALEPAIAIAIRERTLEKIGKRLNEHQTDDQLLLEFEYQGRKAYGEIVGEKATSKEGISPKEREYINTWNKEDFARSLLGHVKEKGLLNKKTEASPKITSEESTIEARFVNSPGGGLDFGTIDKDVASVIKRQPGPIRLEEGNEDYGKKHIEGKRSEAIKDAGYRSIEDFVADIAENYTSIHQGSGSSLILAKMNGGTKVAFIELKPSPTADFYTVNSATFARRAYLKNKTLLWEGANFPHSSKGTPNAVSGQSSRGVNVSTPEPRDKAKGQTPKSKTKEPAEVFHGVNEEGTRVGTDAKGNRFTVDENGVRVSAPVPIRPTREGVKAVPKSLQNLYEEGRKEFLTSEELDAFSITDDLEKTLQQGGGINSPSAVFLRQQLGQAVVPGLRLQDAEGAAHTWLNYAGGGMSAREWHDYVKSLHDEGRVRVPGAKKAIAQAEQTAQEKPETQAPVSSKGLVETPKVVDNTVEEKTVPTQETQARKETPHAGAAARATEEEVHSGLAPGEGPEGVRETPEKRGAGTAGRPEGRGDDGGLLGSRRPTDERADRPGEMGNRRGSTSGVRDEETHALEPDVQRPSTPSKPAGGKRGRERRGANFLAGPGGLIREGSWHDTAKRNVDIIRLALRIREEGRVATPEEQAQLSKYTGFGASEIRNNLFPVSYRDEEQGQIWPNSRIYEPKWQELAKTLSELPEDWQKTLLRSTQYAHYTSEAVTRSIWSALERLGFTGGNILEPGMGIGNFPMTMPEHLAKGTSYTGIEFDGPTALIAQLISPQQNILHDDFIKRKLPNNFFDAAIGNPPFANIKIKADPDYAKYEFSLHDYFFAKSLDKVRPGGLLMFVTSRFTMDKKGDKARRYLSERADFLGAIRLPQDAFKENAGTEVSTDVLFLRKREPGAAPGGFDWTQSIEHQTKDGPMELNEYFVAHPEMILGEMRLSGNLDERGRRINAITGYNQPVTVGYFDSQAELETAFAEAANRLPQNVYSVMTQDNETIKRNVQAVDFNPKVKREGVIYLNDQGNIMKVENGVGKSFETIKKLSQKEAEWLKDYVGLKDLVNESRLAQLEDADWKSSHQKLNNAYEKFVKANGPILDSRVQTRKYKDADGNEQEYQTRVFKNKALWQEDYDSAIVTQLEQVREDGTIVKGPFLQGRTIGKPVAAEVKTIHDALAVSLDQGGQLDLNDIAGRMGISKQDAIETLGDLVYAVPGKDWQLADEYLSGDVVTKLEEAETAASQDPKYERNVEALKKVQPKPLKHSEISVALGAAWIPAEHVSQFAEEIGAGAVRYDARSETWTVEGGNRRGERTAAAEYGTADRSPSEMLEAVLSKRRIVIKRVDEDKKTYTDETATALANQVAEKIKDKFRKWIWSDSARVKELTDLYNRRFNNLAPRHFDGSHLTLPGVSLKYNLFPHQKRAIWRIIQTGNTYLDHAVGAGKTIEMIASGMEMRRLGLIKKPTYVVPNHMLEQFANEFMDLYPLANIMVADQENFHTDRRRAFLAQATLNNPDAIIITHSGFGKISVNEETVAPIRRRLVQELTDALNDTDKQDRFRRGQLEKRIERIEQRFDSIAGAGKKDTTIPLEEMGIDFMFVDEAHQFRKLDYTTNMKVKGVDPNGSRMAMDLYVKSKYLESKSPGRSLVFASGTPVTNTMGELYTVMRFFQEAEMEREGYRSFDQWASLFGVERSDLERNVAGGYEPVQRFASFINIPELMKRVRTFMDVLTSDQLGDIVKRPDIEGGKPDLKLVQRTPELQQYMEEVLGPRLQKSKAWKPSKDEPHNPDPVVAIITDGRFAAIDPRFFNPKLPDDVDSKLNRMADQVVKDYHDLAEREYLDDQGNVEPIKGGTQIVFYNMGFGKGAATNRRFDAKKAFTKRLTQGGIPAREIAWFDEADTDAKKEQIFQDMRSGKLKILIGSAKKMGTGVNVQKRLAALHYLDAPWYPADVEQPHGRIIRQKNQNPTARINWYATEGTYDSTMWQMVARKQRFIDQAFKGDESVRTIEDISEASQYEMAAAIASGDQRVVQLAGLTQDIERLEVLQQAHWQEQRTLENNLRQLQLFSIPNRQQTIAKFEKALGEVGDYVTFMSGEVNGKPFESRNEFGDALKAAYNQAVLDTKPVKDRWTKPKPLAKLNNRFEITYQVKFDKDYNLLYASAEITGGGMEFDLAKGKSLDETVSGPGLVTKATNALNGISRGLDNARSSLEEARAEVKAIQRKLGTPFEQQQELASKIAERAQLVQELESEGKDTSQATAGAPAAGVGILPKATIGQRARKYFDDVRLSIAEQAEAQARPKVLSQQEQVYRQIKDHVEGIAKDWKAAKVQVVSTFTDLPSDIAGGVMENFLPADRMPTDDEFEMAMTKAALVNGLYNPESQTAYIIANNVRHVSEAERVLLHEVVGHHGMRALMGPRWDSFLDEVFAAYGKHGLADINRTYQFDLSTRDGRRRLADEKLARIAETGEKPGILKRLYAMVREALRKLGFRVQLSDSDIKALLLQSRTALEKGTNAVQSTIGEGNDLRFSLPGQSVFGSPEQERRQAKEFIRTETGTALQALKAAVKGTDESGLLGRLFRSPEWWSHPVLAQIFDVAGNQRPERVHTILHDNLKLNDVLQPLQDLKKQDPKHYEWVKDELLHIDEMGLQWRGERDKPSYREHLLSQNTPMAVIESIDRVRDMLDSALDLQIGKVKDVIDRLDREGIDPKKFTVDTGPGDKITIWDLYNQMGDLRGSYFPRKREPGDWAVTSTSGESRFREHYRSRYQALRAITRMKREGRTEISQPMKVEREPESVYAQLNMLDMQKFIEQALKRGEFSPEAEMAIRKELFGEIADLLKERGFRSSRIQRREGAVVKGFVEDPIQALGTYAASMAGGVAKSEAAADMIKEAKKLDERTEPERYDMAKEYIAEQLRNPDRVDRAISMAKSLVTFKYLGFSPRTVAVNMTSLLTNTPAALHQYAMGGKGSLLKVGQVLSGATKDYGSVMAGRGLKDAEEQAFVEGLKGSQDLEQYTRDAMSHIAGAYGKGWSKAMQWALYGFGKSEEWVRGSTMLAAYRLARDQGQSHEEATQTAKTTSNRAHGIYGKASMPMWAMGQNPTAKLGQMGYTYMKFAHNYVQLLSDLGMKQRNMKAFTFALVAPAAVGGAGATLLTPVLMAATQAIMRALGDDRDPEKMVKDTIRDHFGEGGERAYRYGLAGFLGADISSSLAVGLQPPKNLLDLTGPFGGVVQDIGRAGHFAATGQGQKAFETLAPTAAANVSRALRELSGATTRSGNRVWDETGKPYIPTGGETAAKAMGFRSARRSMVEEKQYEIKQETARYAEQRSDLYERYRAYLAAGKKDPEEFQSVMDEVARYNARVKSSGRAGIIPFIRRETLNREARAMMRPTKAQRRAIRAANE